MAQRIGSSNLLIEHLQSENDRLRELFLSERNRCDELQSELEEQWDAVSELRVLLQENKERKDELQTDLSNLEYRLHLSVRNRIKVLLDYYTRELSKVQALNTDKCTAESRVVFATMVDVYQAIIASLTEVHNSYK